MVKLSIIIITLNEEEWIRVILNSLKNQTFQDFEVIVADFNSIDNTRKIAKEFGCKITDGGKWSVGRNNGVKLANANYLLFLDADCYLPPNFLEENLKEFINSKKGTGTVPLKPISLKSFDKTFFKLYDYWSILMSKFSPHCAGCGIFALKKVFNKIGGFDEKVIFAENHEFSNRAKPYGFIILPREMYTSVRRMDDMGRFKFVWSYIYSGLYRLFNKEIKKELFKYD